jgi:hypothetical protein
MLVSILDWGVIAMALPCVIIAITLFIIAYLVLTTTAIILIKVAANFLTLTDFHY